ncbi:class I SAM-dependent methyltransferase [Paraburkholderia sp. BR14263]|uniref:class I SAM-dependent methyltransferase n=1 Tax=unclassified Paraburkholderia TaxID=2615204 RepID=UPI0034CE8D47
MGEAIVGAFERVLMRAFGRPEGILGRLGGMLMAKMNQPCAAWAIGPLEIREHDRVLEIGFGPGAGIQLLAAAAPSGHIDGIDPSQEMLAQATARNAAAIARGRVGLRIGSVERLPCEASTFAPGFTAYSGQKPGGLIGRLTAAGFVEAKLVETEKAFCVLAVKP